jgi:hypothetical protein
MRFPLIILLIAAPSVARAESTIHTPLVDMSTVDAPCRVMARIPSNAIISGPSYDAAISTANCMVMARTRGLELTPTADSVAALDDAVAPAIEILDRVIKTGDAEHKIIALYSKAGIFEGNAARMLSALPRLSPQMGSKEVVDHYREVRVTDELTQPWRHRGLECRRQIGRLASRDPQVVVRDPVIAYMVAASRIVEAAGLAAR